jgi:hypothetical protein
MSVPPPDRKILARALQYVVAQFIGPDYSLLCIAEGLSLVDEPFLRQFDHDPLMLAWADDLLQKLTPEQWDAIAFEAVKDQARYSTTVPMLWPPVGFCRYW